MRFAEIGDDGESSKHPNYSDCKKNDADNNDDHADNDN